MSTIKLSSMSKLRQYQIDLKQDVYTSWDKGAKNILGVLPTGGGKTVVMGEIAREFDGNGIFIAHRAELLGQISTQLAREGVYHNLITPKNSTLRRKISDLHLNKVGKNYINDRCNWLVGGVDTVINMPDDKRWKHLGLMITDEGHHLQKNNKWGEVFKFASNAKLLAFTATPRRADGRALDVFDTLVEGVPARWLIDNGYLVDYRVVCPKTSDLDLSEVAISNTTGDYNTVQIKKAMHASKRIVGDVVREYLKYAPGKLGVTFAVDVEEAVKISKAFNDAGVPAEVVSAKTPSDLRTNILRQFEQRKILQLVNVDLFGEGFDLPEIEVVSFARPTMSFALFCQQFGRVLRLMISPTLTGAWDTYASEQRKQFIAESKKPFALVIDHVGNILQHHFPDSPQKWTLEARERKSRGAPSDAIPLRSCLNVECMRVYEKCEVCCPYCGQEPQLPAGRTLPEQVDGDLQLLTEEVLAKMRGEIDKVDGQCYPPVNLSSYVKTSIIRNHMERQAAQKTLREVIALWAGKHAEYSNRINHKRFFLTFGITVPEAKALGVKDAGELESKILGVLQ
jgi:superfamily II DNA or RNA helicase